MSLADPSQVRVLDEKFWDWIFTTPDGDTHPLKISDGGTAQLQVGNVLILSGSLPDDKDKNRSLQIRNEIVSVFAPADNVLCTRADGDGNTDDELIASAAKDISGTKGKASVTVDGKPQEVHLLDPHLFDINIKQTIIGTGNSGKGEPLGQTRAAAAAYYAITPANSLRGGSTIVIEGRRIKVTYTVT